MRALTYIFLIVAFLPSNHVDADDKGSHSTAEYEIIINNYYEIDKSVEKIAIPSMNQVVIYDSQGNITRRIEIDSELEISTPAILKPIIYNAEFLTKINGVYYYIYDKI